MSRPYSIIAALEQVQILLVDPQPANMRLAEQQLKSIVGKVHSAGMRAADWAAFRRHAATCAFLLDQAHQFWATRKANAAPALQYAAGGQLLPGGSHSTFAVEL